MPHGIFLLCEAPENLPLAQIFGLLTSMVKFIIIFTLYYIPRLCNGSTADSGSACGGSNPPWGILKLAGRSVFFSILDENHKIAWSLRLSV